jgi:hypothetical protein
LFFAVVAPALQSQGEQQSVSKVIQAVPTHPAITAQNIGFAIRLTAPRNRNHGDVSQPSEKCSMKRPLKFPVLAGFMLALTTVMSPAGVAAQQHSDSSPAMAPQAQKPVIEEWVYRVRYGYKDEWFRIFRKYQLAILERQKQLGYVKEFTVFAPSLHTSEDPRWDYRVIIVRTSQDAPPGTVRGRGLLASSSPIRRPSPAMKIAAGS